MLVCMLRPLVVVAIVAAAPAVAAAQTSAATARAAPAEAVASLLKAADAAYADRADPAALQVVQEKLEAAERVAPDDFGVLWRLARLYFWLADDPAVGEEQKSRLGKKGWDYGERAAKARPERIEGWYYAAAGMGNYALGIGVLKAMREGIEGKFKDRLSRAEKIDAGFQSGAIQTAWGRFWFKLPWPKYDGKRAERALRAALERNPDNVRARVYLSELYRKEGKRGRAREEIEKAAAAEPGRYDEAEERRWREVARHMTSAQ
jgi:tetratricopeptide (TPR) repeat protein